MFKACSNGTGGGYKQHQAGVRVPLSRSGEAPEPPANGEVVTGAIVGKVAVWSNVVDSLQVLLAGRFTALLHFNELDGKTEEERAERLFFLEVGESVSVQVLQAQGVAGGRQYIFLSERALTNSKLIEELRGTTVDSLVVELTDSGVVVSIGEGLRGFLHVTKMAGGTPAERSARLTSLRTGDKLTVTVASVKRVRRAHGRHKQKDRLSISLCER